ncbi:MAG: alpha/beta fold hydrolase [Rectinemataceae bacterium]|nr:alpha/beta fold hydrolase [Rectinemataceae bacterium]
MNADRDGSSPLRRLSALLKPEADAMWRIPPKGALPIRMDPAGAREAVLLLHGFTGYPGEMEPLATGLASAGYAVSAPRLPGHGTCRRDFLLTRAEDWARRAYDAYLDLRASYEIVHVCGHSMGALLASAIAVSFSVPRLILLAPAFEFSIRHIRLTSLLAPFKAVLAGNRKPSVFDLASPERTALHPEYWADVMVAPAAELMRLRRLCRKNIGHCGSRILVIAGEKDTSVPVEVIEYLRGAAPLAASFDSRVIPGAPHVFPFDEHAAETVSLVLEWMASP